jgi:hypothetical protein
VTVQLPALVNVMLVPEALQVPAVENETGNPELVVAETTNGPGSVCDEIEAKVIV